MSSVTVTLHYYGCDRYCRHRYSRLRPEIVERVARPDPLRPPPVLSASHGLGPLQLREKDVAQRAAEDGHGVVAELQVTILGRVLATTRAKRGTVVSSTAPLDVPVRQVF